MSVCTDLLIVCSSLSPVRYGWLFACLVARLIDCLVDWLSCLFACLFEYACFSVHVVSLKIGSFFTVHLSLPVFCSRKPATRSCRSCCCCVCLPTAQPDETREWQSRPIVYVAPALKEHVCLESDAMWPQCCLVVHVSTATCDHLGSCWGRSPSGSVKNKQTDRSAVCSVLAFPSHTFGEFLLV